MVTAFYIASAVAVVATTMVIINVNVVHALLYLVVSLLAAAIVFYVLGAPFAAALEVIVYAGAIMVLFVFVVMMLNLGEAAARQERQWLAPGIWIGPAGLSAVLLGELVYLLWQNPVAAASGVSDRASASRSAALWPLPPRRGARFHAAARRAGQRLSPRQNEAASGGRTRVDEPMSVVPMQHALLLAMVLFALGMIGVLMRRNLIVMLMSVEIMLNAAGLAFIAAGSRWAQADGQVMFILILALAAAEVSVGLALILRLFHQLGTLDADAANRMRGDVLSLLALIPAVPLLGFTILFVTAGVLPKRWIAGIGVGSVGISTILALIVMVTFLGSSKPYTEVVWNWIAVSGFTPHIGFYLDALSGLMMVVVAFVSFLIHLYSAEFMSTDEGYSRYFAYMNLFVASMLVLVLADNLLFLYLGWEGVGLCSYLLIGFWYRDPANGLAARKAFVVTRVGDTAMAIGLFVLFTNLGTLEIQPLMQRAAAHWTVGSGLPIAAAALLLGGAVGKSAQLPLQTWLPDAMAGPTPVSALIHAATMVTAGVYLIARTHVLYDLAPPVHTAVAVIGALTLLLAGFSALNQTDLKRILAYSTISQIGYMFLALGVGAWSAGHLPLHDARLLQGAAVPLRRRRYSAPRRGARYLQDGWAAAALAARLLEFPHRQHLARGAAAHRRWLLQQGPHPAGSLVRRRRRSLVVGRRAGWRLADGDLYLPRGLCRVLRSRQARTHGTDRLAHRHPAGRALHPRGAISRD